MYKTSMPKESITSTENENLYNETLMKEIINLKYQIEKLEDENFALQSQLNFADYKYINKLETKLRHIEQYFDDLDDIDYKTIKKEVERILNE